MQSAAEAYTYLRKDFQPLTKQNLLLDDFLT